MSVNNIEGNVSQVSAGNNWFQNKKVVISGEKGKNALSPKEDNGVKISISREGMKKQAKQATNDLLANNYGNELVGETEKLKEQRTSDGIYSLPSKTEDYIGAYANLYDEIVQGYQNGTRERYIEDEASATGYRKMTMEEELNGLDKAFQRAADGAEIKEMITNEFQRLSSKAGNKETSFTDANKKPQATDQEETIGQKMKKLAQVWKDAYKTSGSKESSMEKVLSVINDMFHLDSKPE